MTSLALNFVLSASSKIFDRVFASAGALVKDLGQLSASKTGVTPGVVTSTGAIQAWTTATNLVGSKWYAVEIECRASPGDTVYIYDLKEVVSYQ